MRFIHVILGLATAFMSIPVAFFGAVVLFYFVWPSMSVESAEAFWFAVVALGASLLVFLLVGAGLVASIVRRPHVAAA